MGRFFYCATVMSMLLAGNATARADLRMKRDLPADISPIEQAFSDSRQVWFKFCNRSSDKPISITYAYYVSWNNAKKVSGWYKFDPGECGNIRIWSSEYYTHHFLFKFGGKLFNLTPREYELLGFKFTGWLSISNESFCVNLDDVADILENILSSGCATECRGSEKLVPFSVKVPGGLTEQYQIDLPKF